MPIKVLLADSNDAARRAIRNRLEHQAEIELVAEATNFAQTIQLAKDLESQVIVMDLHMPDESTFASADLELTLNHGASPIVAVSVWIDEETRALADRFGAVTLLDKMELATDLIPAIAQFTSPRTNAAVD